MRLLIIAILGCVLLSCSQSEESHSEIDSHTWHALIEFGYMEGQKDALAGSVKIAQDSVTKCWSWKSSPWDDQRTPTYTPECAQLRDTIGTWSTTLPLHR